MLKHFPGAVELLMFAVLALICAAVVHASGAQEAGLSLLSFPVFVFSAILGLWKSGRLRPMDPRG